MFKHNIKYTDFNGVDRQEDFYFHLSLPELTRIEAEFGQSLAEYAKGATERQNPKEMISFLERIILTSYGVKSPDGRSFQKSDDLRKGFEYSQAYAELFEELLTNPDLAQKFGESIADTGKQKKNQVAPKVVE